MGKADCKDSCSGCQAPCPSYFPSLFHDTYLVPPASRESSERASVPGELPGPGGRPGEASACERTSAAGAGISAGDGCMEAADPARVSEQSSLDQYGRVGARPCWSRRQRAIFQTAMSWLTFMEADGWQVAWVMLSSAPGGHSLSAHHKRLRERIERRLGYPGLAHYQVLTTEGHGVIHALWAWKGDRSFYVPQHLLSSWWAEIHGARVVWIARVRFRRRGTKGNISHYFVSQYCADQSLIKYYSYSWGRGLGFPIRKAWRAFRGACEWAGLRRYAVPRWSKLLTGVEVQVLGESWTLARLRAGVGAAIRWAKSVGPVRDGEGHLVRYPSWRERAGIDEALDYVAAGHTWRDAVMAT